MNKFLISLILIGLTGLASASEPSQSSQRPQMRQQVLDKMRAMESHSHQGRIHILQQAEGCIQSAKTPQEYGSCERDERQARERLRDELQPQHQALRDELRQLRQDRHAETSARKP